MNLQLIWLTIIEILKSFGVRIPEVNIPKRIGGRIQEPKTPYIYVPPTLKPRLPITIDISDSKAWEGIVWHHSAQKDNENLNDYVAVFKYHTSYRIDYTPVSKEEFERRKAAGQGKKFELPFKTIAYNGIVERLDQKLVFHWGRPLNMTGAHSGTKVSNLYNTNYLGFCALGNYDLKAPNEELWKFCLSLTRSFMDVFNIPVAKIIGHKEVYGKLGIPVEKLCPGKYWSCDQFRKDL